MQGLNGFKAQAMSGDKGRGLLGDLLKAASSVTPGAGSYTATENCVVDLGMIGAGGSGGDTNGKGGSGGGAVFKRFTMRAGEVLAWNLGTGGAAPSASTGTAGTSSTVTLPDGRVLTAGGGAADQGAAGAGVGGDLNRTGGVGGIAGGAAGADGENGGTGASSNASSGGGGGAAGFTDFAPIFIAAAGSASGSSTANDPGSGGGGSNASGTCPRGGHGGIYYIVHAVS